MMGERSKVYSFLFALAVVGILSEAYARPSDQDAVWQLEDDYTDYGVLERQQVEEEDTDSEGSNSTWWSERRPCSCANAQCGCCTGRLFPLPVWLRPRMCTNLTYIQDEFALKMAVTFNDVVMYRRKVSGRNPPPVCVSPPRLNRFKVCIKLQDVYLFERNMHACMAVEGLFNKQVLFERMLGCMRMGTNGFAIVNPEDGGGLPSVETEVPDDEEPNDEDDYDQVDEEYDPVEEETVLEAVVATNEDEQEEDSDTENAAAKSKEAGITKGESIGVKKGSVKTAGTTETPNAHESYGSMKTSVKTSDEGVDSMGSVSTNEVAGSIKNTKPQESVSTTEDFELAKTTMTDEDVVNNDVNRAAEVGSNTAAKETQESTITSPKTTIEPPKEGQDMGGSEKGDGDTVSAEPWKNSVAKGSVNEESNKTEAKSPTTEDTSEKTSGEKTRGPNGTSEEMVDAQNGGQGWVAEKKEIPKRNRDLFDDEIVGVGTVEEL